MGSTVHWVFGTAVVFGMLLFGARKASRRRPEPPVTPLFI